jgi:hypothetical protein
MTKRTLPLLLLTAVFAAACASPAVTAAGPDDTVSTSIPPGSGGPSTPRPTIVTPTPGLQNVLATSWIKAVSSADGRTLSVWFWGSPCLGVDHVDVKETPDRVALTLYQGTPPSMVGMACIEIAMVAAVRVDLSSPLGDRTVVDGSRHADG